jgi:alpha-tubulin suppressor-like RCC1 family protein
VTVAGQALSNVVAIAAGSSHSLAYKKNGVTVAWGLARQGTKATKLIAVAADPLGRGDLALREDGAVIQLQGSRDQIPAWCASNVVAISVGGRHCLALKRDGTVVAWGLNTYGQTNVPEGLSNVIAISAGGDYSLALRNNGVVVGWGSYHPEDLPAGLTNIVAIAGGWNHSLALRKDGTVIEWKGRRGGLRLSGSSAQR